MIDEWNDDTWNLLMIMAGCSIFKSSFLTSVYTGRDVANTSPGERDAEGESKQWE